MIFRPYLLQAQSKSTLCLCSDDATRPVDSPWLFVSTAGHDGNGQHIASRECIGYWRREGDNPS